MSKYDENIEKKSVFKRAWQIWCEKEKIRCLCHGCSENKAEISNGKCSGCNHCGKIAEEKCLIF